MRKLLSFLNLFLILILIASCGKNPDDMIHIWHEENLSCEIVAYPMMKEDCTGKHISCTTWGDGRKECLIFFNTRELERKIKG